jgi:hypothetical protein
MLEATRNNGMILSQPFAGSIIYLIAPYMDVSRNASFSNVKCQRRFAVLYTAYLCRRFILLARMAFAGKAPICKTSLMLCKTSLMLWAIIGLSLPRITC